MINNRNKNIQLFKNSILLIVFLFSLVRVNGQVELYISTNGNDLNPGTREEPLASLIGARDAIRNYKRNHTVSSSFVVTIDGGSYEMKEPLVLTPEDGGTAEYPVFYKAAKGSTPIFSGGKKILGFKVNGNGLWEVRIPESVYYNWRFDQLYVNGERAVIARTPNNGFLKIGQVDENIWVKGSGRAPEKAQQVLTFDEANFKAIQQVEEDELKNLRFRAFHKWDFTLRFIDKIEKDSSQIYTSGKGMKPWNSLKIKCGLLKPMKSF